MALFAVTAISIAPASTMPWIELAADISGVCKVAGTLLMTSKPTQRLRTKIVTSTSRAGYTGRPFFRERWMDDLSVAGDNDPGLQLVVSVQRQRTVLDQVQQQ